MFSDVISRTKMATGANGPLNSDGNSNSHLDTAHIPLVQLDLHLCEPVGNFQSSLGD